MLHHKSNVIDTGLKPREPAIFDHRNVAVEFSEGGGERRFARQQLTFNYDVFPHDTHPLLPFSVGRKRGRTPACQ